MLEVKARILESARSFNNRLSDIVDCFLRGNLLILEHSMANEMVIYHDLHLLRFMREENS